MLPISPQNSTGSQPDVARKFSKAKPLAAQIGVCPKTVARWGASGKIATYKLNSRVVLFDAAEVFAFVMAAKVPVERL
jgi:hypothetical protein